jgi:hypothetical protein
MAQNRIPVSYDPLVELLVDAKGGLAQHGVAIDVKQNDLAAITTVYDALVGTPEGPGGVPAAVPGLKALWNAAKEAKTATSGLFRSAKSDGRALAKACVNVLKPRLGDAWNNAWQAAGFTDGSLAIPENPMTLLQQFRAYFAAKPAHERPDIAPGINATAAACEAAADAIADAATTSNDANADAGAAKAALEAGIAAARRRLSGLRDELDQLLDGDDARWYAFGFERPDDPETPEVPENLVLTPANQGDLIIDWDNARRAESYRVRVFNDATNVELAETLVQDSDVFFNDLPVAVNLRIEVTAINDAGETQPLSGTTQL